jgi:hypothetical protein
LLLAGFISKITGCGRYEGEKVLDISVVVRADCQLQENGCRLRICNSYLAILCDEKSKDLAEISDKRAESSAVG